MDKEILKDARFDVKIISGVVNIDSKNLSFDEAQLLVNNTIDNNADDEWLQKQKSVVVASFGFTSVSYGEKHFDINAYAPIVANTEPEIQTCPRRTGELGPWDHSENLDTWEKRGPDRCCSFCGSIHPEDLLTLMREKGISVIEPSTKKYKLYLNRPEIPNANFGAIKFYVMHFSKQQIDQYNALISPAQS